MHGIGGADKLGDLLYATFLHYLLLILLAGRPRRTTLFLTLAWCFAVEFLQLTAVPGAVAEAVPGSRLVLGSGFDVLDLLMYGLGAVLPFLVFRAWARFRPASPAGTPGTRSRPGRPAEPT